MTKHGTILVVEDDPNDVLLVRKAFAEVEIGHPCHCVHAGREAIRYLSGQGRFADRATYPFPFLVLLDLKMPDEDGFEVLRWLHARPGLKKRFTLIVMSTASPDPEVQLAYELGAQSYLQKPIDYSELVRTLRRVKEYWIELNRLPEIHI